MKPDEERMVHLAKESRKLGYELSVLEGSLQLFRGGKDWVNTLEDKDSVYSGEVDPEEADKVLGSQLWTARHLVRKAWTIVNEMSQERKKYREERDKFDRWSK